MSELKYVKKKYSLKFRSYNNVAILSTNKNKYKVLKIQGHLREKLVQGDFI